MSRIPRTFADAKAIIKTQRQQMNKMIALVEDMLDKRERQFRSQLSMENAMENFTNPKPECNAYMQALDEAATAEMVLRDYVGSVK